jgi:primosomal protein N' (replication factor Y)
LAGVLTGDSSPVRIARIDADTTRLRAESAASRAQQRIDGWSQMIAKGHDTDHIAWLPPSTPTGPLFSSDFALALFGLLLAASRPDDASGCDDTVFRSQASWRLRTSWQAPIAGLSPFGFSALVRAEPETQDVARASSHEPPGEHITLWFCADHPAHYQHRTRRCWSKPPAAAATPLLGLGWQSDNAV